MRKRNLGKRITVFLLALVMASSTALAAKGDISNVSTGLDGAIDTADTISLPIRIMDYESDGMLFEFAENNGSKSATDFGATWAADYASETALSGVENSEFGRFWENVTASLNTDNRNASYLRVNYNKASADNGGAFYGRAAVIVPNDLGGIAMDNVRYLVMVYRSNITSGKIGFWVERSGLTTRTDGNNRVGDLTFTSEGTTNWTYAVYDLKQGNLANTWGSYGNAKSVFTTLPLDSSGDYMDIAHVALFANKDQATAFGEYAVTDGSDRGDNRAFGLLRGSRNQSGTVDFTGIDDEIGNSVQMLNTYGSSATVKDYSTVEGLGYTLLGTFGLKGIANIGLLESSLSSDGYPVYKKEVVDYMAKLLKATLEVPERTSDGWKNYRYIKGTASNVYGGTDLATALRTKINGNMGTYAAATGKNLVGTWSEVSGNITSYYDAAYFLLNSIFVDGSYNDPNTEYDYLVLSAGTDSKTDDKVYVFDGGFVDTANPTETTGPAIDYNATNGTVQNTSATGKAHFYYETSNTTTLNPFTPIINRNTEEGMTKSPYYQDDGVINGVKKQASKDTLYKRNFSFAMASEGEFVYHADDELFFEFEGDDDVYLFINGELVMDIGSAHSLDIVRFDLNDYVNAAKAGTLGDAERNAALALEEGGTYTFKFYYMERHSYGSNIRISTNIRVTDPSMTTTKTAWQDGTQVDFGGIVDKDKVVEYGFGIKNTGEEKLYNLTFTDNNIGVQLDPGNGLKVTGSRVTDVSGGTLEASDLTAVVSHPDYDDINVTFADNNALKTFLTNLTADGTEANGGLYTNATVQIRGIGYKLSDEQIRAAVFDNTVLTTATNQTASKTLQGQATMRVFVPSDPMYYEWAGHTLNVSKEKLIGDILAAAQSQGNALAGKVPNLAAGNVDKIELVTKAGNAISSSYVSIDSSYNLTINYDTPGSKLFYVKITYNNSKNTVTVPVLINVTDVKDSVYVLDYGLNAELTEANELFKNDAVTVPGRATESSVIALGSGGTYAPNEISFTSDANGVLEGDNYSGTYTLSGQNLTFVPTKFMEKVDTFQVAMNVYETDITPSKISGTLDINNEVEMYKNVSVLPANVVYYEDNFPAITYTTTQGTQTNSFVAVGTKQSVDQTQEYGQDEAYQNSSDMSGNSITKISIDAYRKEASFTFTGTGFELVGRTNATDSGTLIVNVKDSIGKTVKNIPVITEFDNNDDGGTETIYQVPVIKVKDLPHGTYTVSISGVPAGIYDENGNKTGTKTTYLYVDGLRIYQPLGETNENYLATENGAQFIEIRNEIANGKVAVSEWTGKDLNVSAGLLTWTENYDGSKEDSATSSTNEYYEFVANEVDSVNEYLLEGPNNEVYMMGDYVDAALLLYVTEDSAADMTGRERNLQIGVHAVDEGVFVGADSTGMSSTVKYGINKGTEDTPVYDWVTLDTVTSGTEQYYTIDYTKCPIVDGRYQVVVLIEDGMASFTNLKLNGLSLNTMSETGATSLKFVNGLLESAFAEGQEVEVSPADVPAFMSLRAMMMALDVEDDVTDDTLPEDGEDTTPDEKGEDDTTPGEGVEDDTTPEEDGDDTTSEEDEKPAKPENNSDNKKPAKPENNSDNKKPAKQNSNGNDKKPAKQNNNGNNTKPDKSNKDNDDSVVEEKESVTSDESGKVVVPDKGETVTVPEENTSESTSVWDWIVELIGGILRFFGGLFAR